MPRSVILVLLAGLAAAEDPFFIKTTVVVTATRAETELAKSPVSASVTTSSEVEARNVQVVDQALSVTEGVMALRTKGPADTLARVQMRGFNGQSRNLVLVDGQPVLDGYNGDAGLTTLPVGEVDRIEVARGPFSSLYGGNAMGGVVNILTKPVDRRMVEAGGQYGSLSAMNYTARYSDRFFNRLGTTIAYRRLQTGGYPARLVTNAGTIAAGGIPVTGAVPTLTTTGAPTFIIGDGGDNWYNQHAWRAKAEYSPSGSAAISFQYMRQEYGYGYDNYSSFLRDASGAAVDRGTVSIAHDGVVRRLTVTPSAFLSGSGKLTSHFYNARYQRKFTARNYLLVFAGLVDTPSNAYTTPAADATLTGGSGTLSGRASRAWNGNVQWNWEKSSRNSFIFGAETRHDRADSTEYALGNYTDFESQQRQTYFAAGKAFNQALFAQDEIRVSERLQIIAGGRLDYWKTYGGLTDLYTSAPAAAYAGRGTTAVTGKLAAVYQAARDWTFRASLGTAFRNPNIYEMYRTWRSSLGTLFLANPALEPEKVLSWETGLRKRVFRTLDLDAAWFWNDISDLIYRKTDLAADPTGRTRINTNAGEGRSCGLEFGARHWLTGWLHTRASYTWTRAIISRNTAEPLAQGKQVPYFPEHMAGLSLIGSKRRWTGSVTARYVSAMYSTDTNTDVVKGVPGSFDPFFVTDFNIGYRISKRVQIYGGLDNALDRRFFQQYRDSGRLANIGLRIRL